MTRSVRVSIVPCNDHYERHDDFSSPHVFRFSVEERYRLIAPSWFTSKNIQDGDGDGDEDEEEEDDDIVREILQKSVNKDMGFSNDDFISRAYENSVSDFISKVGFLSGDTDDVEFIEDEFFSWVEEEMTDVFYLTVTDVKIVVLIREETDGEEFTGHEFDGEFKPDDDEDVEMAPAAPVEVDQEVIEIEDDEEEEEEEEEYDELGELMAEFMEVEEPDHDQWFMEDDIGEGGLIEEQWWEGSLKTIQSSSNDRKRDGDCMICMDGFSSKQEEVAEMPCSHVFHKPCVVKWLKHKNSCPLCRFEIHNNKDDISSL